MKAMNGLAIAALFLMTPAWVAASPPPPDSLGHVDAMVLRVELPEGWYLAMLGSGPFQPDRATGGAGATARPVKTLPDQGAGLEAIRQAIRTAYSDATKMPPKETTCPTHPQKGADFFVIFKNGIQGGASVDSPSPYIWIGHASARAMAALFPSEDSTFSAMKGRPPTAVQARAVGIALGTLFIDPCTNNAALTSLAGPPGEVIVNRKPLPPPPPPPPPR